MLGQLLACLLMYEHHVQGKVTKAVQWGSMSKDVELMTRRVRDGAGVGE